MWGNHPETGERHKWKDENKAEDHTGSETVFTIGRKLYICECGTHNELLTLIHQVVHLWVWIDIQESQLVDKNKKHEN